MAVKAQTGGVSYMFWDEASMQASGVNASHKKEYDNLIERGILVKADTVEEAAAISGLTPRSCRLPLTDIISTVRTGRTWSLTREGN